MTTMLSLRDRQSHAWATRQLALVGHRNLHLSADPLLAGVLRRSL